MDCLHGGERNVRVLSKSYGELLEPWVEKVQSGWKRLHTWMCGTARRKPRVECESQRKWQVEAEEANSARGKRY